MFSFFSTHPLGTLSADAHSGVYMYTCTCTCTCTWSLDIHVHVRTITLYGILNVHVYVIENLRCIKQGKGNTTPPTETAQKDIHM